MKYSQYRIILEKNIYQVGILVLFTDKCHALFSECINHKLINQYTKLGIKIIIDKLHNYLDEGYSIKNYEFYSI